MAILTLYCAHVNVTAETIFTVPVFIQVLLFRKTYRFGLCIQHHIPPAYLLKTHLVLCAMVQLQPLNSTYNGKNGTGVKRLNSFPSCVISGKSYNLSFELWISEI